MDILFGSSWYSACRWKSSITVLWTIIPALRNRLAPNRHQTNGLIKVQTAFSRYAFQISWKNFWGNMNSTLSLFHLQNSCAYFKHRHVLRSFAHIGDTGRTWPNDLKILLNHFYSMACAGISTISSSIYTVMNKPGNPTFQSSISLFIIWWVNILLMVHTPCSGPGRPSIWKHFVKQTFSMMFSVRPFGGMLGEGFLTGERERHFYTGCLTTFTALFPRNQVFVTILEENFSFELVNC